MPLALVAQPILPLALVAFTKNSNIPITEYDSKVIPNKDSSNPVLSISIFKILNTPFFPGEKRIFRTRI